MATYEREQSWPRWSGTIRELQDATEQALGEIRQWIEEDPEVSIRVVQRDGLTVNLGQPSELADALDVRDLSRIETLSIEVGLLRLERVQIRLDGGWLGEGMRLSVRGTDRTRVEGLARQLSDVLTPRHSVGVPGLYGFRAVIAVNIAFWGTMAVAIQVVLHALVIDSIAARLVLVFASATLLTAVVVLAVWAGPTVEILEPGGRSRYQRWRWRLLTVVGTIVLSIATSVAATALYSGD